MQEEGDEEEVAMQAMGASPQGDTPAPGKEPLYRVYPSANLWLFSGRGLKGPDIVPFVGATVMIIAPAILYFVFVADFFSERDHLWVPILQAWLIACALVFHFCTAFTDPGIIPRRPSPGAFSTPSSNKSFHVEGIQMTVRWCKTCNFYRPPRAVHCGKCNNCVERFDHHCPWTGNCVGQRNYRYYLLYVLFCPANAIWLIVSTLVRIIVESNDAKNEDDSRSGWNAFVHAANDTAWMGPLLIVYSILVLCAVGFLGGLHLFLSSRATTTNEHIKKTWQKKDRNPNDEGSVCTNWLAHFCAPRYPRYVKFHHRPRVDTWPWHSKAYRTGPPPPKPRLAGQRVQDAKAWPASLSHDEVKAKALAVEGLFRRPGDADFSFEEEEERAAAAASAAEDDDSDPSVIGDIL